MKQLLKAFGLMTIILLALSACKTGVGTNDNNQAQNNKKKDGTVKIGLAVSTLNNPFFETLTDGAKEAAKDEGYKLITADAQDDAATQMNDIGDLLQQDIDVLLINPTDSDAVTAAVELANDKDVPVITVDRSANGGDVVTHIASDNVAGGEMAGKYIAKALDNKGKVVELEGVPGASATRERGEGFHNVIDDVDGIEIVSKQSADFDRTKGLTVMENIIQSSDDIDAVFAHNDEMALGAVQALASAGLDDVIVVGFDATDDARAAIKKGTMDATIAQQPELIGKKAIEMSKKILANDKIDDFIPIDLKLITK